MWWRLAVAALCLGGCVRSNQVHCDDGRTCPADTACDVVHHTCVDPHQLVSCAAETDGATCAITLGESPISGECHDNVCMTQRCGDALRSHAEVCDGAAPAAGTCIDFEYDYGALTCSSLCAEGLDGCKRLGWRLRNFAGVGRNGGLAESNGTLWIANQNGVGRCDAATCTIDTTNKRWHHGVWAIGNDVFVASNDGTVRHFDGQTWTDTQVNPVGQPLFAIWGRSPTDIYAVGALGTIHHYNGSVWTPETSVNMEDLRAVWGTTGLVVAVGKNGTVIRNTGIGWASVAFPALTAPVDFYGVWGASADRVYAVGAFRSGGEGYVGEVLGGTGQELLVPTGTPGLTAISGRSASELYVATDTGDILLWDGRGWSAMVKPAAGPLFAVLATPDAVYASGTADVLFEYQNAGWTESLDRPESSVAVQWGASTNVVFAIQGCDIHSFDGNNWTASSFPSCIPCTLPSTGITFWNDMFGTSATDVYAAGPYGALLHFDGTSWDCPTNLPAVFTGGDPLWSQGGWGSAANDVYVVGGNGNGTVLYAAHYNGSTWQDISDRLRPLMSYAFDAWGTAPNNVYVVGVGADKKGRIAHYNGSTWSAVDTAGIAVPGRRIWGSGPNDIYVIGAAGEGTSTGLMVHYDGTTWSRVQIPEGLTLSTTGSYNAIDGSGPNDVYVAASRALLHFDGTSWYPINRPRIAGMSYVQVIDGRVLVAGADGTGVSLVGDLQR